MTDRYLNFIKPIKNDLIRYYANEPNHLYDIAIECYINDDLNAYKLFLTKAARLNYPDALYMLGVSYMNGYGFQINNENAYKYLTKAVSFNFLKANILLVDFLIKKYPNNLDKALECLYSYLGIDQYDFYTEIPIGDYEYNAIISKANKLYALGIKEANLLIGRIYFEVYNNFSKAMNYYNTLGGEDRSDVNTFILNYLKNNYIKFPIESFEMVSVLSTKGVIDATELLAFFYSKGIGVKADFEIAMSLLKSLPRLFYSDSLFPINKIYDDTYTDFYIEDGKLISHIGNNPIIKIPEEVRYICSSAFRNSDIFSITLPEGLEVIENNAFINCKRLVEVINKSNIDFSEHFKYAIEIKCEGFESMIYKEDNFYFYDDNDFTSYLIAYDVKVKSLDLPVHKQHIRSKRNKNYIVNSHAFEYIVLNKLYVPSYIFAIKDDAFNVNNTIDKVVIDNGVKYIGRHKANCVIFNGGLYDYSKIEGGLNDNNSKMVFITEDGKIKRIK